MALNMTEWSIHIDEQRNYFDYSVFILNFKIKYVAKNLKSRLPTYLRLLLSRQKRYTE